MATFTYHLGVPALPSFDYNPFFDELFNLKAAVIRGTPNSTSISFTLANGLVAQIGGTGFTYDAAKNFVGGTITTIKLLLANGTTSVMSWTGLTIPAADFSDATPYTDQWFLGKWIASGNDVINGGGGHDDLLGYSGNDTINGGAGDDYIDGGAGKDTFDGGSGYDQLSFSNDYFDPAAFRGIDLNTATGIVIDAYGNSETFRNFESYRGTKFADKMVGNATDEMFTGLGGSDVIDGGGGVDTVRYIRDERTGGTAGVTVDLGAGFAIDGFGRRDTLANIENVQGTDRDDKLTGSSGVNSLRGDGGNDILNGLAGADKMRGGAGNDTYYVDNAGDSIDEQVDGNLGIDTVYSSVSFSFAASALVKGSLENLNLTGTGNINGIGNTLNNVINGNSGVNILNGDAGNDSLNGGLGADTLTGGAGIDSFIFNTALTSVDRITDFSVKDDTIRLENAIFTALTATGVLNAQAFTANAAGVAQDALDRIIYETDTGKLIYDSNGNAAGGAVHFATLTAGLALTNADFLII